MTATHATIILTRYMYLLDETLYTLQEAILDATSFEECVFWCGEIYYSGYQDKLWNFVFEFYYNFCAITHPKYERKLAKLQQKDTDIRNILAAITLLFYTKKNYEVFSLWSLTPTIPNKIYIGRNPKWYNSLDINPKCKNLIRSLYAKNWENVVFYIKYLDPQLSYDSVKTYFRTVHRLTLKNKLLEEIPYSNKKHIILTLIKHLFIDENLIQKKAIFRAYNHANYKTELETSNEPIQPAYKTLPARLKYSISNNIGCFPLQRYSLNGEVKEIYWYHWEYYAYNCLLWKQRFDKCKIIVEDEQKAIVFADAEEYEAFCEQYYYETDEQCQETQDKNIPYIPKISLETWFSSKIN